MSRYRPVNINMANTTMTPIATRHQPLDVGE